MAITLNDNQDVLINKPIDARYYSISQVPYIDVNEVFTQLPAFKRYIGQIVNIANVEYVFKNGIADVDLVVNVPNTLSKYINESILDRPAFAEETFANGKKVAVLDEEYGDDFVGINLSANLYNYKSVKWKRGSYDFLYNILNYAPFVDSTLQARLFENNLDIKKGVHISNFQAMSTIIRTRNQLNNVQDERGTIDYCSQFEAYNSIVGSVENVGFRSKLVQPLNNTVLTVSRNNNIATITTTSNNGFGIGETLFLTESILGFPKTNRTAISWERFNDIVTINTSLPHDFGIDETVTLSSPAITGRILSITSTSVTLRHKGADQPLTVISQTLSHRTSIVIASVITNSVFTFVNTGPDIPTTASTGTITAPIVWNHRASGNAPNAFIGKTYFGTSVRNVSTASAEFISSIKVGTNNDTVEISGRGTIKTDLPGTQLLFNNGTKYLQIATNDSVFTNQSIQTIRSNVYGGTLRNTAIALTTLDTYTLPANSLNANGDEITINYDFNNSATGNNKQFQIQVGASVVFSSGVQNITPINTLSELEITLASFSDTQIRVSTKLSYLNTIVSSASLVTVPSLTANSLQVLLAVAAGAINTLSLEKVKAYYSK